ncbi:MAG: hypothetical protein K0R94_1335 [Burkholderiales bacterium]|nr:hypothetical protein [Burkholderiales bacterium]
MKFKQKIWLVGLVSLPMISYQSTAEPLLQCLLQNPRLLQDQTKLDQNINTYVIENDNSGRVGVVYGKWYSINNYDPFAKNKHELINKNGNFLGKVKYVVALKDVGRPINLRSLYYISGEIVSPNRKASTQPPPGHALVPKAPKTFYLQLTNMDPIIIYNEGGTNSKIFYTWDFKGYDEDGTKFESQIYCQTPKDLTQESLHKTLNSEVGYSNVRVIPESLLNSFKNHKYNIISYRLSHKQNILSDAEISSLRTIEWRIAGLLPHTEISKPYFYDIEYRLSPNDEFTKTSAQIYQIKDSDDTLFYADKGEQYYEFEIKDKHPAGKDIKAEYFIKVTSLTRSSNRKNIIFSKDSHDKIEYIKKIRVGSNNDSEEPLISKPVYKIGKTNVKVIDDDFVIEHREIESSVSSSSSNSSSSPRPASDEKTDN